MNKYGDKSGVIYTGYTTQNGYMPNLYSDDFSGWDSQPQNWNGVEPNDRGLSSSAVTNTEGGLPLPLFAPNYKM